MIRFIIPLPPRSKKNIRQKMIFRPTYSRRV